MTLQINDIFIIIIIIITSSSSRQLGSLADLVYVSDTDVQITSNVTTQLNGTTVMSCDSQCQLHQTLNDTQVIYMTRTMYPYY